MRFVFPIGLTLSWLWTAGCGPTHQDVMTFLNARDHIAAGSTYRLAPPDTISVFAPQAPEVDGTVSVRADGTVHLRLLGDVRVAGLTAAEAAAKVQRGLQTYYKDPVVHVSIAQHASKVFYMYGEVGVGGGGGAGGDRGTGQFAITGRDTILDVLTSFPPGQNAWLSQVRVIRPNLDDPDKTQTMIINFERMIRRGDFRQNILLQEGDIVWIPPTPQAWIGYRIREILQPIAPVMTVYQTPAQILGASEVYADDDDDDDDTSAFNVLGNLRLP